MHCSEVLLCLVVTCRCSSAFFNEERTALRHKRQKMRLLQQGKMSDVSNCKDLPEEIPLRLNIGTKVTGEMIETRVRIRMSDTGQCNVTSSTSDLLVVCFSICSTSPWCPWRVVYWTDRCSGHQCCHVSCHLWPQWSRNTHCAWLRSPGEGLHCTLLNRLKSLILDIYEDYTAVYLQNDWKYIACEYEYVNGAIAKNKK